MVAKKQRESTEKLEGDTPFQVSDPVTLSKQTPPPNRKSAVNPLVD